MSFEDPFKIHDSWILSYALGLLAFGKKKIEQQE